MTKLRLFASFVAVAAALVVFNAVSTWQRFFGLAVLCAAVLVILWRDLGGPDEDDL